MFQRTRLINEDAPPSEASTSTPAAPSTPDSAAGSGRLAASPGFRSGAGGEQRLDDVAFNLECAPAAASFRRALRVCFLGMFGRVAASPGLRSGAGGEQLLLQRRDLITKRRASAPVGVANSAWETWPSTSNAPLQLPVSC